MIATLISVFLLIVSSLFDEDDRTLSKLILSKLVLSSFKLQA